MRLGLWSREVAVAGEYGEGLKTRNEGHFHSLRAALLDGILGGESDTASSAASITAAPSVDSGLLGGVTGTAGGLLSPVLGGNAGASSSEGALLGLGIGPTSAPLLSVAVAPSTSSPLLSIATFPPAASASVSGLPSAGVGASSTTSISQPITPSASTSLARAQPSTVTPTTLLTSFTAATDTAPSSSGIVLPSSGTGNTGSNSGGTGGVVDNGGGTNVNGASKTSTGHSNTTTIVIGVVTAMGAIAIFVGFVIFIRRYFRNRRLGKAEYPPSSPLLPPMEDSFLPPSIARSISLRSGASSYRSGNFGSSEGSAVLGSKVKPRRLGNGQEGFGEGFKDIAQLSPLPPAAKGGGGRDMCVGEFDFSLPPKRGEFD